LKALDLDVRRQPGLLRRRHDRRSSKRKTRRQRGSDGAGLRQGLEDLRARFPKNIGDVRGMGLMQAMEFVEDGPRATARPEA
jgi:4-aminobutyrate aminotransferase-like enzyme